MLMQSFHSSTTTMYVTSHYHITLCMYAVPSINAIVVIIILIIRYMYQTRINAYQVDTKHQRAP